MNSSAIRALQSVLRLPAWQVRWDRQVGLDLRFGPPTVEFREPFVSDARSPRVRAMFARRGVHLQGTHWFVAYPGLWRLTISDGLSVRETSSEKRLNAAVARLRGEKIMAIAIDSHSGRTRVLFDLGSRIDIRWPLLSPKQPEELWCLHARSRFVAVYSGGQYDTRSTRSSGEPRPIKETGTIIVAAGLRWRNAAAAAFENRAG